jgi:hypothetical protein
VEKFVADSEEIDTLVFYSLHFVVQDFADDYAGLLLILSGMFFNYFECFSPCHGFDTEIVDNDGG